MLTLDIVDFIENLNSQLMQLTRFKIFPLLCSARLWGQPGEISLFVSCFSFVHMNNLQLRRVRLELATSWFENQESLCPVEHMYFSDEKSITDEI